MSRLVIGDYPPGSMLKPEFSPERKKKDKREVDEVYLDKIRSCPCIACGREPSEHKRNEAAHVRMSGEGKTIVGLGIRPDDAWAVPLCARHHQAQHQRGERHFWDGLGINPIRLALRLHKSKHNLETMRQIIILERERMQRNEG